MAFNVTARQSAPNAGTATASLATGSATPTANSLFFAAYGAQVDNGAAELPVLLAATGGSLTYTLVDKHGDVTALEWGSGTGFCIGGRVDRAPIGGTPSAFAVTVDGANAPSNAYHSAVCFDVTGHNTTTPIVQTARNGARINPESSTASGSVTLPAAPTAGNLIVVVFMCGVDGAGAVTSPTAGAGKTFTTVTALSTAFCTTGVFYRVADGAESATITTSDLGTTCGNYVAIAFEIAAATGGAITGNGSAVAPTAVAAGAGTVRVTGTGSAVSPLETAVGTGAVLVTGNGSAVAPLAVVTGTGGSAALTGNGSATATPAAVNGAGTVLITGAGSPVDSLAVVSGAAAVRVTGTGSVTAPPATVMGTESTFEYLTDASGNGRYFVDQDGAPFLLRGDSPWSMFTKLSPSEVDIYIANRLTYGVNTLLVSMIGATANGGPNDNGATYDGILPFTGGDPTVFNSTYWARMDSYISKARDAGITLMIYPMDGWNTGSGCVFDPNSVTNTQCQTYGNTLATRYPAATYPHIIWAFGGDFFDDATVNARFNACLTGIRATGDTRLVTIQLGYDASESHNSTFWEPKVDWDFVYEYYTTYTGMKDGYDHSWTTGANPKPALFGEGAYEGAGAPHPGTDVLIRRQAGWALTSGSPGDFTGQEGVWNFFSDWQTRLDTTAADQLKVIRDAIQGVAWWTLIPDDSNQLVTAGRGTRITTDGTYPASNTYVTAARAADGTLAVIYLPNAASAITVDMTKIGANPTATWVDPTSGATFSATPGSSYSRGNNAAGATDWLLILTGDVNTGTGTATAPAGSLAGSGSVRVTGTGGPTAAPAVAAGAGSVRVTGSGAAVAPAAVAAGTGGLLVVGTGGVVTPFAVVSGFGNIGSAPVTGSGAVTAPAAAVSGAGTVSWPVISGTGSAVVSSSDVDGVGSVQVDGNGSLVTSSAIINGSGSLFLGAVGDAVAPLARVSGYGSEAVPIPVNESAWLTLGDLMDARATHEQIMLDVIGVRHPGMIEEAFDPGLGYAPSVPKSAYYTGKATVQARQISAGILNPAGLGTLTQLGYAVHGPVGTSFDQVAPGDIITVLDSADPLHAGKEIVVKNVESSSFVTARRVVCVDYQPTTP